MIITKPDIIAKIRKAIDDIEPSVADSFSANTDNELWQAVQHAVEQLLLELPVDVLEPQTMLPLGGGDQVTNADGSGYVITPDGSGTNKQLLRFISMKLTTWTSPVYSLIEAGSDEEMRQRSLWGRGTPDKPKVMLDSDADGKTILRYWTAGKESGSYVHTIDLLNYIPMPTVVAEDPTATPPVVASITCALKGVAEKAVIYRAASIFFEGKKEPEAAEKFRNI